MKIESAKAYSISKILDNNIIFSKDGSIAYVYELEQPEKFQLNEQRLDSRLKEMFNSFQGISKNSYLHKQDIYLEKEFDTNQIIGDMYLSNAMREHFVGRKKINHYCILAFVLTDLKSLEKSYLANPFQIKKGLNLEDKTKIIEFENSIEKACNILDTIFRTKVKKLEEDDVKMHIYKYVNGFEEKGLYDIDFKEKKIGDNFFEMYSISQSDYISKKLTNISKDPISKEDYTIFQGYMDSIGETILGNHIYNQIIYFEGDKNIKNELDFTKQEFGKLSSVSEKVKQKYLQLTNFLEEVEKPSSEVVLVKSHFNIIMFDKDKEKLELLKDRFKTILSQLNISFHQPEKEVLKNLFLGSIIGREKKLHKDHFFISHIKESLCLFTTTTPQKNDKEGVWFNDRLYNLPLKIDLWDANNRRMEARNGIIIANTGGGKSVFALNFITQFLEQNINVVVAEFGRSFEFITNLYPEISSHIVWNPTQPLGLNPFDLQGDELTNEKLSFIKTIVLKIWRIKDFSEDSHVSTSLNILIKEYYHLKKSNHFFEDFYYFIVNGSNGLLERLQIEEEYFNLKSFKHNGRDFIEGGIYENVFKVTEGVSQLIKNKRLVVFELTEVKKDPFLVTLILLLLQEAIDTNILQDRSKRGILIFDEFAEAKDIKDAYSTEDVLTTVAILYQKIRKENGAIYIIIQDPSQLPLEYSEKIRASAQVLVVLPSNQGTAEKIREIYRLQPHEFDMVMSLRNNKKAKTKYKYTEQFIRLSETSFTCRLELSKQALLSFQTQGEVWKKLKDDMEIRGGLQSTIEYYKDKNLL